jgi:hypothetical protein
MQKLKGKVAVVTGGSAGIGLAIAKRLVEEGAHVTILGRRRDTLDAAAAEIGRDVTAVQGDAASLADLDRLFAIVKQSQREPPRRDRQPARHDSCRPVYPLRHPRRDSESPGCPRARSRRRFSSRSSPAKRRRRRRGRCSMR